MRLLEESLLQKKKVDSILYGVVAVWLASYPSVRLGPQRIHRLVPGSSIFSHSPHFIMIMIASRRHRIAYYCWLCPMRCAGTLVCSHAEKDQNQPDGEVKTQEITSQPNESAPPLCSISTWAMPEA